jgi:hypothetical protein
MKSGCGKCSYGFPLVAFPKLLLLNPLPSPISLLSLKHLLPKFC